MKACLFCRAPFPESDAGHVCPKCGAPQPLGPDDDRFTLLASRRGFRQDADELEKRFYEISRGLHPDRFAAGGDPKWKTISVERMSAVNLAYRTLTHPVRLREYLLEMEGVSSPNSAEANGKKAQIPAELAEEWFELQDAVMEDPEHSEEKLRQFESDLRKKASDLQAKVVSLENEYDANAGAETRIESLRKIDKLSLDGQYLKSMERDLQKLKARLGL